MADLMSVLIDSSTPLSSERRTMIGGAPGMWVDDSRPLSAQADPDADLFGDDAWVDDSVPLSARPSGALDDDLDDWMEAEFGDDDFGDDDFGDDGDDGDDDGDEESMGFLPVALVPLVALATGSGLLGRRKRQQLLDGMPYMDNASLRKIAQARFRTRKVRNAAWQELRKRQRGQSRQQQMTGGRGRSIVQQYEGRPVRYERSSQRVRVPRMTASMWQTNWQRRQQEAEEADLGRRRRRRRQRRQRRRMERQEQAGPRARRGVEKKRPRPQPRPPGRMIPVRPRRRMGDDDVLGALVAGSAATEAHPGFEMKPKLGSAMWAHPFKTTLFAAGVYALGAAVGAERTLGAFGALGNKIRDAVRG